MTSPRAAVSASVAGLLAASAIVLTAPQASAADMWRATIKQHTAQLQACKVPVEGGYNVKFRLTNKLAAHGHRAWVQHGSTTLSFKAGAGVTTGVQRLYRLPGTRMVSVSIGHNAGADYGDAFPVRWLYTC